MAAVAQTAVAADSGTAAVGILAVVDTPEADIVVVPGTASVVGNQVADSLVALLAVATADSMVALQNLSSR